MFICLVFCVFIHVSLGHFVLVLLVFVVLGLVSSVHQWLRGTVERLSLAGELSVSCARPVADGDHLCG